MTGIGEQPRSNAYMVATTEGAERLDYLYRWLSNMPASWIADVLRDEFVTALDETLVKRHLLDMDNAAIGALFRRLIERESIRIIEQEYAPPGGVFSTTRGSTHEMPDSYARNNDRADSPDRG